MNPEIPGKKIFLIEDDQDIRTSIVEILEDEGYQTDWAANGEDALAKLRSNAEQPALILLDLRLPVKDGFQFRQEQMGDERLSDIPVIVISADGRLQEKTGHMRVADLLKKPIDIEELVSTVKRNLLH